MPGIGIGKGVGFTPGTGVIPSAGKALLWLDGTISVSEFVDQSGNGRNFTITNQDWTSGEYFPYKSVATISAPVGDAVLFAADKNSYLYGADANSPNQIPIVSFFQNIDYENIGFCRHVPQSVDGNGVEMQEPYVTDIVWYATPLTGSELTVANTYYSVPTEQIVNVQWVAKDGNDTTGDGSESLPYLTIDKGQNEASTGDTIYVKSGNYNEVVYFDKSCTIKGIGFTQMIRTNHCFRTTVGSIACVIEGFDIETIVGYRPFTSTNTITSITINRCKLKNTTDTQQMVYGTGTSAPLTITNCVFAGGSINWDGTVTLTDCYSGQAWGNNLIVSYGTVNINQSRFLESSNSNSGIFKCNASSVLNLVGSTFTYRILYTISTAHDVDLNVDYCTMNSKTSGVVNSVLSTTNYTGTVDISITNSIINNYVGTSGSIIYADTDGDYVFNDNTINNLYGTVRFIGTSLTQTLDAKRNTFSNTAGNGYVQGLNAESLVANIESNILDGDVSKIKLLNDLASAQISSLKKNIIIARQASPTEAFIEVGTEGDVSTYGKSDGSVIEQNACYGPRYFNKAVGSQHGIFIYAQDIEVKYNRIEGTFLAFVIKSAGTSKNTRLHHNLIVDCDAAWTIKGAKDVYIYNETCVFTSGISASIGVGLQHLVDPLYAGNYSTGLLFKNNIIADLRTDSNKAYFDTTTNDMVSSVFDYNIYYSANGSHTAFCLLDAGAVNFATWQALPQDVNSTQDNPDFTGTDDYSLQAGGGAVGAGETLAAAYDDGLDASTDWGDDDELPTVVTKQQTAPWDVGAYVS